MSDNWQMERIVFGLRHKRTFQVTDKFGEFTDKILPLQGRYPFPEKCFTKVGQPDRLSVEVRDDERTLSVTYNVDGIVLNCDMLAEPLIEKDTVLEMFREVAEIGMPLTEGKNRVDRLGVLFNYSIGSFDNSAQLIFSNMLKTELKGKPDDIIIKFALKLPAAGAVYDPDKKADYKNVFVEALSFRKPKEEDSDKANLPSVMKLSIDYQHYFDPVRTYKDVDIAAHFSAAQDYISESIMKSNLNIAAEKINA